MDGALIATIASSAVGVGGTIGGGFWYLGRLIGRLEGKVGSCAERINNLEQRINGILNLPSGKRRHK